MSKRSQRIPVIALVENVLFPETSLEVRVAREFSKKALKRALKGDRRVVFVLQKGREEVPKPSQLHRVGVLGQIEANFEVEDFVVILARGLERVEIDNISFRGGYFTAEARVKPLLVGDRAKFEGAANAVREYFIRLTRLLARAPEEVEDFLEGADSRILVLNAAVYAPIEPLKKQALLESEDLVQLARDLAELLLMRIEYEETKRRIEEKAQRRLAEGQRQVILQELKQEIEREIGGAEGDEFAVLRRKIEAAGMPQEVKEKALEELERLKSTPPMSPEATVIRNWLDWLLAVPWKERTEDNLDVEHARRILDEDHYGLEEVKERILEYLSVLKLKGKTRGQVLCFVGPPGVGKTSLARSIARALGRKFVRASLGGLRDEAEIKGHRRTYVGALPGKIIQGMRRAGTVNPVFLLDEVDKMGADFRGDPQAALMEVLDPELNSQFNDHYLEVDYDLSEVLFITTANTTLTIPKPLLDRMDVIYLRGYTDLEKLEIAKRHLVPKLLEEHGLTPEDFKISDEAILKIIREYTAEAGVRELERRLARLMRKAARRKVEGKGPTRTTAANLQKYLDLPPYKERKAQENLPVGVFYGLAWTEAGGELLRIEVSLSRGKGGLITTGHLGEVMEESIRAALSYIKANRRRWGLPPDFHQGLDIHVHIPEGAIPKDGPSAGVAVLGALLSAFTKTPIPGTVAATGEITLTGQVLPVGGLIAKLLAAKRSGVKRVYLPEENREEVEHLNRRMRGKLTSGLELRFVREAEEILKDLIRPVKVKGDYREWLEI